MFFFFNCKNQIPGRVRCHRIVLASNFNTYPMRYAFSIMVFLFGLGLASSAQIPTMGEVYNFNIGDEFHYRSIISAPAHASRRTIIGKVLSNDNETVTYTVAWNSYVSSFVPTPEPHMEYTFLMDTTELVYNNLSMPISEVEMGFQYDTLYTSEQTLCGSIEMGYNYCLGEFEPECWTRRFALNMGTTYDYYSWTGSGAVQGSVLFYYHSGEVECGIPDNLTASVPVIVSNPVARVYPTLVEDQFTIEFINSAGATIQLFDNNGRLIFNSYSGNTKEIISIENFPSGLCQLILTDKEGNIIQQSKLIFQ
jgi:hypothetical protein